MTLLSCRDCGNFEDRRDIDGVALCAKNAGPTVCCIEFNPKHEADLSVTRLYERFCLECSNFEEIDGIQICAKNHTPKIQCDRFTRIISRIKVDENDQWNINAYDLCFRDLNKLLRTINDGGAEKIELHNIFGQRYIGTDLAAKMKIDVYGTPGNDLGAFMNGPRIEVHGNAQDGCGNTMNDGLIIVHGHAGDIAGFSMRGGKVFIRDDVGYRSGIHMKEFKEKKPYLVVGGTAGDFLGEYMAGGVLVVLGLNLKENNLHKSRFVGTGMHGGVIYIRGKVKHLGKEVENVELTEDDYRALHNLIHEFCDYFKFDADVILDQEFSKLVPVSYRPYGKLYAY